MLHEQRHFIKRRVKIVAAIVLGFGTSFAFAYVGLAMVLEDSPNPFANTFAAMKLDRNAWFEDEPMVTGGNRRGHMAEDILRHHLRMGMDRKQIVALLGKPEHCYAQPEVMKNLRWYSESDRTAKTILVYYLGEELAMTHWIDRAWLYLYLDDHGRYFGGRIMQ